MVELGSKVKTHDIASHFQPQFLNPLSSVPSMKASKISIPGKLLSTTDGPQRTRAYATMGTSRSDPPQKEPQISGLCREASLRCSEREDDDEATKAHLEGTW